MNAALTRRAETNFVYPQLLRQLSVLCYPACNFLLVNKKKKRKKERFAGWSPRLAQL